VRDLHNHIKPLPVIAPQVATDDTALTGAIIDRQGYDSLEYVIQTGTLEDANATFTTLLQEGDLANLADAANVADGDMLGTEALASFTYGDDGECFRLGYTGSKRYTRLTVTPAGNTGNAPISAVAILGHAALEPTD
jgi:hypothetical protein